jgi:hypothetical protein
VRIKAVIFSPQGWAQSCATTIVVALMTIAARPSVAATDVLTWHNDLARTGQNLTETVLTPSNVNPTNFGKIFVVSVDGEVYAQPLIASGLTIPGQGVHDVLYIATEHDTVYACDANDGTVLWQSSMLAPGETPYPGCGGMQPEVGITATPVIDRASGPNGTIYLEAMSQDATGNAFHRLHALDLTTGAEQFSGPVNIGATYPGTGDNSNGVNVIFDPKHYKERAGLVLNGGVIYLTWASRCENPPYTGWVMGYDQTTLAQVAVVNLTPNGSEGSIWACGAAPPVDADGYLYVMTANGTFDTTLDVNGFPNQGDYGNAIVKLSTANNALKVVDYWTMFNTAAESLNDTDFGSGGPILLPDMIDKNGHVRYLAVGAGKDGLIYIWERGNMGKFNATSNSTIYQVGKGLLGSSLFGAPAYFNSALYFGPLGTTLRTITFTNARLNASVASQSTLTFHSPGTIPSISANGSSNGIVWALEYGLVGVLHAYDATDLMHELYNSNQAANSRDQFGAGNKFAVPTVANGKVYVGGSTGNVAAFGLLGSSPSPTATASPTATVTPTPTPTPTPTSTVQITVQTSPSGVGFIVDNSVYYAAKTFTWATGSKHTIGTVDTPQDGATGVQYLLVKWSDGGAYIHFVAPTKDTTYTATFSTQYYLTMNAGTGGKVSPSSGWKNSGATVSLRATLTNTSSSFTGWTGTGAGSFSGSTNPVSIVMGGPISEMASFAQSAVQVTVQTSVNGPSFSVDGTTYTSAQTFSWVRGSSHTIATTSPQNGGTGVRYVWSSWTGGGAISHAVAPTTNTTYTANFNTQYFLTMTHTTGGTVTPANGWKASGTTVSITGKPTAGYTFSNWTGSGNGSYSGANNPAPITMGGPITENATFTRNQTPTPTPTSSPTPTPTPTPTPSPTPTPTPTDTPTPTPTDTPTPTPAPTDTPTPSPTPTDTPTPTATP